MTTHHNQSHRQSRTRFMIQLGGLLLKSKIAEAFSIAVGDDLQSPESFPKAAMLLGFLSCCRDNTVFHEENIQSWEEAGRKLLQSVRPIRTKREKDS